MLELDNAVVYHGNNLDVLPTLPDNSVDSIVTDPPYELGFMGKSWDNSGIAYSVELWTECMRVLKPGGHLLAFGGSRTWHRLAVAIEDAGFEMRDSIAWLYGSGFPKSMDISKQIDKRGGQGAGLTKQIGEALRQSREKREVSKSQADKMFCNGSTNWAWFEGRPNGQRPPSPETFALIVAEWPELESLASLIAAAEREVTGQITKARSTSGNSALPTVGGKTVYKTWNDTAPATPEAKQWQGWGTALKPAFEPVVVARKPLGEKTVAANVLKWGTGGLNIDGSRIGSETITTTNGKGFAGSFDGGTNDNGGNTHTGRWPANIILDPYTAELLDEQTADLGASRFFYQAKASKKDRNEGLEELEGTQATFASDTRLHNNGDGSPRNKEATTKNFHPTVKPTTLMEYLIKLVTPEGGTVLDPFTGSGSTGKAALLNGFKFIGIELTDEYLPIIEGRLKWANEQANQPKEGLF